MQHPYWDSAEGKRMSDFRRQLSGMLLTAQAEPRSKRARTGNADELRDLLAEDAVIWQVGGRRFGSIWPRLRAHVSVDLSFSSRTRNPPRVDKLVKFILDELGSAKGEPIAYKDDRQVKLLYARHHRKDSGDDPSVHATIQTVAQIFAGVRRASELEQSWDLSYANHDYASDRHLWEAEDDWDDTTPFGAEMKIRGRADRVARRQEAALYATDLAASNLVASLAHRRARGHEPLGNTTRAWNELLERPYSVALGTLPERRGEPRFPATAVEALLAFTVRRPDLVPLFPQVGLTLFVVENNSGKDLDNIVLDVLPGLLDVFQPTELGRGMWSGLDELRRLFDSNGPALPAGEAHAAFIEAVSVPSAAVPTATPGSVVLALSHGHRYYSWWSSYNAFVREVADRDWDA